MPDDTGTSAYEAGSPGRQDHARADPLAAAREARPADSNLSPVTALRRAHPAWQIEIASGIWQAVSRPAQNSQHILIGPSFEGLAAKLEREDAP